MTTHSLLDELEGVVRLAEKATPGEWVCYPGGKRATVHSPRGHVAFFSQRIFGARGEGPVTADEMVSNARLTAGLVNWFRTHHAEIAALAKRLEAAERDARVTKKSAETLCRIYFEIAAEAVGEDQVRAERDRRITAATQEGEG